MTNVPSSDVPPNPDSSHRLRKRELRHAARSRRRVIAAALTPQQRVGAGRLLAGAVLGLVDELSRSEPELGRLRVAAYESLPEEPPTGPLIEALHNRGHEVIVPVTLADWSLQWRRAEPGAVGDSSTVTRLPEPTLDPDHPEKLPDAGAAPHGAGTTDENGWLGLDALSRVDLVLTPGLSVDRDGTRLGQGGGCYDRALRHRNPAAPVLTLLHEGELSEAALPCDEHDASVDGVVTTSGRVVRVTGSVMARKTQTTPTTRVEPG